MNSLAQTLATAQDAINVLVFINKTAIQITEADIQHTMNFLNEAPDLFTWAKEQVEKELARLDDQANWQAQSISGIPAF